MGSQRQPPATANIAHRNSLLLVVGGGPHFRCLYRCDCCRAQTQ